MVLPALLFLAAVTSLPACHVSRSCSSNSLLTVGRTPRRPSRRRCSRGLAGGAVAGSTTKCACLRWTPALRARQQVRGVQQAERQQGVNLPNHTSTTSLFLFCFFISSLQTHGRSNRVSVFTWRWNLFLQGTVNRGLNLLFSGEFSKKKNCCCCFFCFFCPCRVRLPHLSLGFK